METMTLEELRVACINAAIRERDELRAEVARLNDVFARANHRTSVAEAELAALKARIADACPAQAVVDDREECGVRIWVDRSIGSNRTRLGELEGKRVRLVVEE